MCPVEVTARTSQPRRSRLDGPLSSSVRLERASLEEGIVGILRGDRLQTIELGVGQIAQDRARGVDSDLKVAASVAPRRTRPARRRRRSRPARSSRHSGGPRQSQRAARDRAQPGRRAARACRPARWPRPVKGACRLTGPRIVHDRAVRRAGGAAADLRQPKRLRVDPRRVPVGAQEQRGTIRHESIEQLPRRQAVRRRRRGASRGRGPRADPDWLPPSRARADRHPRCAAASSRSIRSSRGAAVHQKSTCASLNPGRTAAPFASIIVGLRALQAGDLAIASDTQDLIAANRDSFSHRALSRSAV